MRDQSSVICRKLFGIVAGLAERANIRTGQGIAPPLVVGTLTLLLAGSLLSLLPGCSRPASADYRCLKITRWRYAIDPKQQTAWVVAEIHNPASAPVEGARLAAIAMSKSGQPIGENRVEVGSLPAGSTKAVSVRVTCHGTASTVRLRLEPPPKPSED